MSTKKLLIPTISLVIMAVGAMAVSGQSWNKLGWVKADHKADHATIFCSYANKDVYFHRIKLTISDAPMRFVRVAIVYGNADRREIEFSDTIPAGGETRVFELDGRRHVDHIDFWYESASLGGKNAKVTLLGLPEK